MSSPTFIKPHERRSETFGLQFRLGVQLVHQSFQARFRRAVLGMLWVFAEPIARMIVFVLVFEKALGLRTEGNTSIYIFIGLLTMRATTQSINGATMSPKNYQALIRQSGIDRRMFPPVAVSNAFVDYILSIPIILLLVAIQPDVPVPWHTIPLTVPILMIHFALLVGIGWITAPLNVHYPDVGLLVQTVASVLFYLSPTFWDPSNIPPEYQWIVDYNPFAYILMAQRDVLAWGEIPDWQGLGMVTLVAALLCAIGWRFYSRQAPTMVDHL